MRVVTPGNVNAKAVMTGTGQTARQTWPPVNFIDETIPFSTPLDLEDLPYQGFDGRTDDLSKLSSGVVFGGRYSAQSNDAPTYEFRVMDQKFDGASLAIETIIPTAPRTITLPSMLVIAAKTDGTNEVIGVEYGSNGVRIISLLGSTIRYQYSIAYTIGSGARLRVERFLSWIQVFVNGVRIGAAQHSTFNMLGAPGVGVYSSVAPNLSTPIGSTRIFGGSSLPKNYGGMAYFARGVSLPRVTAVTVLELKIAGGRSMRAIARNARWTDMDGYNRNFTLKLNGSGIGQIGGFNGTDYTMSNPFNAPANSVITVDAYTFAAYDYARIIKSGSVELVAA